MTHSARLSDLLDDSQALAVDPVITNIHLRADQVGPNGLFLACRGASSHGLDYVDQAIQRGAAAVLWEPALGANYQNDALPNYPVEKLSRKVSSIADRFFGHPSSHINIAGVTGTNGKTSTVKLIADALENLSLPCGMLGTLGYGRPENLETSSLTTPDAVTIQRILAAFQSAGLSYAAMEVSSHGLDQHRVAGVRFGVAVFTNLSRDHLDYHRDMDEYAAAKAKLFSMSSLSAAVVNLSDSRGPQMWDAASSVANRIGIWVGEQDHSEAEQFVCARKVKASARGITLEVESSWGTGVIESTLLGHFNALNLLSAAAVLLHWGTPFDRVLCALESCGPVPGRMESLGGNDLPLVVVDYSHTPDSLEKALNALTEHCEGELIVVFGCGGDRDPGKRPMMGEIAARLADRVYVTDDNPRNEPSEVISSAILAGINNTETVTVEHDRSNAIKLAIGGAASNDVVLVAGKGHEDYQIRKGEVVPFDDREHARRALMNYSGGSA